MTIQAKPRRRAPTESSPWPLCEQAGHEEKTLLDKKQNSVSCGAWVTRPRRAPRCGSARRVGNARDCRPEGGGIARRSLQRIAELDLLKRCADHRWRPRADGP